MIFRLLDIVISLVGLVLLFPVFIVLSILIKIDSKGPVFFKQLRVGRWNKDFYLLKFRTMRVDAEKMGQLTVGGRDARITKVGFLLRKYKADEFPQLINVLFGSMSMVGPRPEVRHYVNHYSPEQMKILQIKPGITDNASIEYSDENEVLGNAKDPEKAYVEIILPHKIRLNQEFLANKTLVNYFRIIAKTLLKIVA